MKKTLTILFIIMIIAFSGGCSAKTAVTVPDVKSIGLKGRNDKTTEVFNYIRDNFGNHMISAQQESTWMGSVDYEMDYLMDVTGKLPAIRGLDLMNDDFDGVAERAVEWDRKGGI